MHKNLIINTKIKNYSSLQLSFTQCCVDCTVSAERLVLRNPSHWLIALLDKLVLQDLYQYQAQDAYNKRIQANDCLEFLLESHSLNHDGSYLFVESGHEVIDRCQHLVDFFQEFVPGLKLLIN